MQPATKPPATAVAALLGDEAGLYRRLAGNKEREVVALAFGEFGEQAERRASL
jgi:hypothetical protein